MKKFNAFVILVIILLCPIILFSQVKEEEKNKAAAQATNPLAYVTKVQFQPIFTFFETGGKQFSFFSRFIKPSKSIALPFIKSKNPDKYYTIYRLEAPIVSQTVTDKASKLNATGTGDFILLDVVVRKTNWGLAGLGGGVLVPLASPETLGLGKWCAGPIGIVSYTKFKNIQLGLLAQQFYSFAGDADRADQNFLYFQPQIVKLFRNGYFIQSFPIMKFDWETNKHNIPVNLLFGKAFAKDRTMFVGPQYVASGPLKNSWSIMFNINSMFQ